MAKLMRSIQFCLLAVVVFGGGCGNENKQAPNSAAPAPAPAPAPRPASPNAPVAVQVSKDPPVAPAPQPAAPRPQSRYLSEPEIADVVGRPAPTLSVSPAAPRAATGAPARPLTFADVAPESRPAPSEPQPSRALMALEAENAALPELRSDDDFASFSASYAASVDNRPATRPAAPRSVASRRARDLDLDMDGPELSEFDGAAYAAPAAKPAARPASAPRPTRSVSPTPPPISIPAPRPERRLLDEGPEIG